MKNRKYTIKQQLPAYPLFVKDPFFSVWSPSENLNESDTVFWTGKTAKTYGLIYADGKTYAFMGLREKTEKLVQTSLKITAFGTEYSFTCDKFDFNVKFVSPLPPDDLTLISCPVCYAEYSLTPKTELKEAIVSLFLDEEHCYDRVVMPVRMGKIKSADYETSWFGLKKQLPMSQSFDDSSAEWGYRYLSGRNAAIVSENMLNRFIACGSLDFEFDENCRKYISAYDRRENVSEPFSGTFTAAFDDTVSVFYFGDWLKGYYFDDGKTVLDAIADARKNKDAVFSACERFDKKLRKAAKPYGEDYLLVLYAGLRQTMAAHKLVKDRNGKPLFLSKECHSNGCMATVDVSYPSVPLFLLYNPVLAEGMLRPVYKFARFPIWEFDFAPHDVGTYPYACGQTYALVTEKNGVQCCEDFYDRNVRRIRGYDCDTSYTHYPYYMLPAGSNVYDANYQMPVEECGNMLVMQAAILLAGGDVKLARDNFDLLSDWVEYLVKYGLVPGSQLCTDDFAGHLDKNVNLSVKAIVGIEAYAIVAEKLGKTEIAEKMRKKAADYAAEWKKACAKGGKNTPLVFDGNPDETFSLKYNMAFDVLFGSDLFDASVREKEVETYLARSEKYGVPLDSRSTYTKSDWILWTTTLTDDREKRKALIAPVAKFLRETETRYPFTDWYYADSGLIKGEIDRYGKYSGFKNRTVQGGLFITLLADSGKLKCKNPTK